MSSVTDYGWQELANAVIVKAAEDYRRARYREMKRPYQVEIQREIHSLERFFRSAWFSELCDLDGKKLLRDLNKQMGLEDR